ncbi:RNA polymerase C-22 sterol desaturase [Pichia californica]|uniref:C-22 sterol desaturase ERG5 n=1 Tax=Pichia californica TaxID=460514 RepID=A0A9P6WIW8_9ASCO|nr:RNA polymerase C-22 sterol desaturase [[Candida] californica]KAG0687999.1 RNA polymerase C-22 sterol desaturase [[Candida] californica]
MEAVEANVKNTFDTVSNSTVNDLKNIIIEKTNILSTFKSFSWFQIFISLLIVAITYDQISYQLNKGSIAGPRFKIWPFIGPFLESLDPKFDEYVAKWNSGPLSCVSIFHKFVVIASDTQLARKIFQSPSFVKPCVVDVAVKILRPTNWVFLDGKAHVDYRKGLNPLFTKKALEDYIPEQEKVMDEYLNRFVKISEEKPMIFFHEFREYMCAISLRTFCGDYITEEQIKLIADNYYKVTAALELVNFPIIIPYTKTWYGKVIADQSMKIFEVCAQMSKDAILKGKKPNCVLDAWITSMYESNGHIENEDRDVKSKVRLFSNREISEAIFTFLFASQDASSSLCCWLFQIISDRPEIAKKIREEQLRIRGGDPNVKLTPDLIDKMEYTNMVVRETLRYRPPVIMVPYVAKKAYPVTENYTVPKGAMIIPSVYPALHDPEVYENPDEFIPDRWVPGSKACEAKKNWLVFGTGTHVCLGQTYVMMSFTALIGKACMFTDFKHTVTPLSEEVKVFATIFPMDDLILQFRNRDPTTV